MFEASLQTALKSDVKQFQGLSRFSYDRELSETVDSIKRSPLASAVWAELSGFSIVCFFGEQTLEVDC